MKLVTLCSLATANALQLKGWFDSKKKAPLQERICPCCLTTVDIGVDADPNQDLGWFSKIFNHSTQSWYDAKKTELTVMHGLKVVKEGQQLLTVNGQKVETVEEVTDALAQVKNTVLDAGVESENVTLEFGKRGVTGKKLWFDNQKKNHRVCQECYDKYRNIPGLKSKGLISRACRKFPILTGVTSFLGYFVLAVAILGCVIAGPYILAGLLGASAISMLVAGIWMGFSPIVAAFFGCIYIGTRERKSDDKSNEPILSIDLVKQE